LLSAVDNTQKRILSVLAFSFIVASIPFSILIMPAYADCVSYDSALKSIVVSCSTDFADIASHITDSSLLENLGNGEWVLNTNIRVNDGAKLTIDSAEVGWLKVTGSNGITVYGQIDISGSKITSWDNSKSVPIGQLSDGSTPRGFISFRGSEGGTISGAEIAYLGYNVAGRRGLDLYGDGASHDLTITGNSKFHDDWRPYYSSSGAYNILIENSEFYNNNFGYAIDAHSQTSKLTVTNNNVHNNDGIGIICALQCTNVLFDNNVVHDNSDTGLFFSRQTTNSEMKNNLVYNQPTAFSISVYQSQNNQIHGNAIRDSTNGITVHNPSPPDAYGKSTGNKIFDNSFQNVQTAIRALASSENTFSNSLFETVSNVHFSVGQAASITIENQKFADTKIKGDATQNEVIIQKSGLIAIGDVNYDTDATPFRKIVTSQTLIINSIDAPSPPAPPVDAKAPAVSIASPVPSQTIPIGNVKVTGSAADEGGSGVKAVEIKVDEGSIYQSTTPVSDGDWSSWSASLDISVAGPHTIFARAIDNANNEGATSIQIASIISDTTSPTITISSPKDGDVLPSGSVVIAGTASDETGGSGINEVVVKVDNVDSGTVLPDSQGHWSASVSNLQDGSHTISAVAFDNAGNTQSASVDVTIKSPDVLPPSVSISDPTEGQQFSPGKITVSGTSSDNSGGSGVKLVEVRVDGNWYQTAAPSTTNDWAQWSITMDISTTGTHSIQARATDNSDNQASNTVNINIQSADTTAPKVAITSPTASQQIPQGAVTVTGTSSDESSGLKTVELQLDSGSYQTATPKSIDDWSTWSTKLSITTTGTHKIQARATDNAGNQNWYSVSISVR